YSDGSFSIPVILEANISKLYTFLFLTSPSTLFRFSPGLQLQRLFLPPESITALSHESSSLDISSVPSLSIFPSSSLSVAPFLCSPPSSFPLPLPSLSSVSLFSSPFPLPALLSSLFFSLPPSSSPFFSSLSVFNFLHPFS
ncbi:hypothetical protein H8G81_14110, partial [Staphylococcus aureus]|uniref:hypothetical protein n=1 Tax=Staphylococcus aureus TaxID=1280 RepID=UPI001987E142|nr:hypothetical protein [Staphylococcus aureus]